MGSNLDNGLSTIMSDNKPEKYQAVEFDVPKVDKDGKPISKSEQKRLIKQMKKAKEQAEKAAKERGLYIIKYLFTVFLYIFLWVRII